MVELWLGWGFDNYKDVHGPEEVGRGQIEY